MRCVDILASFELEINKLDDTLTKPLTDDSLYWINQATMKFIKDRFNGNAPKRTSYEQNEKRTRDLVHLFSEITIHPEEYLHEQDVYCPYNRDFVNADDDEYVSWEEAFGEQNEDEQYIKQKELYYLSTDDPENDMLIFIGKDTKHPLYDSYEYLYPKNLMFVLNEDVVISDNNDEYKMDTCVFECTADSFMYRVNNKLTDFHYRFHRARPLRIRTKRGFKLLTDKKYKINSYTLGFLKTPSEITNEDPYKNYKDFEDHTWLEIIKIAAQMYIENQSDPRYRTITNEVLTQE